MMNVFPPSPSQQRTTTFIFFIFLPLLLLMLPYPIDGIKTRPITVSSFSNGDNSNINSDDGNIKSRSSSGGGDNNDGAPWQSTAAHRSTVKEELRYSQLPPTVFSPTGRLVPVEKVIEAAKIPTNPRSNILFAMKCPKDQSLVVVSTVITSPHLNTTVQQQQQESSSSSSSNNTNTTTASTSISLPPLFLIEETISSMTTTIFDLTPTLVGGTAGNGVDGHVLKTKLQAFAEQIMEYSNDDISSSSIAKRIADHLQIPTQTIGSKSGRMLASHAVIMGNGQIWRIDPTGQFWNCNALVLGKDSDRGEVELYKRLTNDGEIDLDDVMNNISSSEAIDIICDCMNQIIWPKGPTTTSKPVAAKTSSSSSTITTEGSSSSASSVPCVYWHAIIMKDDDDENSSSGSSRTTMNSRIPRRRIRHGAFLPPAFSS